MAEENPTITVGKDVWNVADGYTKFKILKWLVLLDKFEMIAIYGYEDIELEGVIPESMIPQKRISGLYRLKDTLKLIIENVSFVIKKDSKENFKILRDRLIDVESVLDDVKKIEVNQATQETSVNINEEWFNVCLVVLQDIKEKLNQPINDANLIFRKGDEISMDDLEKDIILGG